MQNIFDSNNKTPMNNNENNPHETKDFDTIRVKGEKLSSGATHLNTLKEHIKLMDEIGTILPTGFHKNKAANELMNTNSQDSK